MQRLVEAKPNEAQKIYNKLVNNNSSSDDQISERDLKDKNYTGTLPPESSKAWYLR